jgi:hypothetical protein
MWFPETGGHWKTGQERQRKVLPVRRKCMEHDPESDVDPTMARSTAVTQTCNFSSSWLTRFRERGDTVKQQERWTNVLPLQNEHTEIGPREIYYSRTTLSPYKNKITVSSRYNLSRCILVIDTSVYVWSFFFRENSTMYFSYRYNRICTKLLFSRK